MLIEYQPDPLRPKMVALPEDVTVRLWLNAQRFITVRPVNTGDDTLAVEIAHFTAPGGHARRQTITISCADAHRVLIR